MIFMINNNVYIVDKQVRCKQFCRQEQTKYLDDYYLTNCLHNTVNIISKIINT